MNSRIHTEKNFWDGYSGKYDKFMKRMDALYADLIEEVRPVLKPEHRVIELAAGTGLISLELASFVKNVYAMDLSENMIRLASSKAREQGVDSAYFVTGDAYDTAFADSCCDVCLLINALHVMKDPNKVLGEVSRILKPDGLFIAATFCHGQSFFTRTVSSIMSLAGFKAFQKFSIESCKQFLIDGGFKIVEDKIFKDIIPLSYLVAMPGSNLYNLPK